MHYEINDHYFNIFYIEIQLKKHNLKSVNSAQEFGHTNWHTGLANGLVAGFVVHWVLTLRIS